MKLSKAQLEFLKRLDNGWQLCQNTTWGNPFWLSQQDKVFNLNNILTFRALKTRKLIELDERRWELTEAGRAALDGGK